MYPHTKFGIPTSNKWRYASDTILLSQRPEVKVTVTWKQNVTLCDPKINPEESGGSVVECLTRDLGVASSSLTGGSVMSLCKTLYHLLSTGPVPT